MLNAQLYLGLSPFRNGCAIQKRSHPDVCSLGRVNPILNPLPKLLPKHVGFDIMIAERNRYPALNIVPPLVLEYHHHHSRFL
jgi:hypothetical protein